MRWRAACRSRLTTRNWWRTACGAVVELGIEIAGSGSLEFTAVPRAILRVPPCPSTSARRIRCPQCFLLSEFALLVFLPSPADAKPILDGSLPGMGFQSCWLRNLHTVAPQTGDATRPIKPEPAGTTGPR